MSRFNASRRLLCLGLMILGFVLLGSGPALAGRGNPVCYLGGTGQTTLADTFTVSISWYQDGVLNHALVTVPMNEGDTPEIIAQRVESRLNSMLGRVWTFQTTYIQGHDGWAITGTPVNDIICVDVSCEPPAHNAFLGVSAAIDPTRGTASFDVTGDAAEVDGEIILGIEGMEVSADTRGRDANAIKAALLQAFRDAGLAQAYLDETTGYITIPNVSTGDPIATNGEDLGAFIRTSDPNHGGLARIHIFPSEHFTSTDGMITFTGSTPNPDGTTHVTFVASGTETASGLGAYTDAGDGSFDVDLVITGRITNGNVTLDFGGGDTLTISFSAQLDTTLTYRGSWVVTGSTGALAGADGGGSLIGRVASDLGSATFMLDGNI